MKDKELVYWKMRNGKLISVDEMDINHLRNVLKMIIRNNYRVQVVQAKPKVEFKLNGDIAQSFFNDMQDAEFEEDVLDENTGMSDWRETQYE